MITNEAEIALLLDNQAVGQNHLRDTCKNLDLSFESVKHILSTSCPNLYDSDEFPHTTEIMAHARIFFCLGILYGKKISQQ